MADYQIVIDPETSEKYLETKLQGYQLLFSPQLNKGTAFTEQERHEFKLLGKLPFSVETLEQQVIRVYEQLKSFTTPLQQNIFLNALHDTNQILFYKLVEAHITEILPIIYTPHVAAECQSYSHEFRRPRGLYLAYPDRDHLDQILDDLPNSVIELIVVTDGQRILGIGDQGVGGIGIPIGKLMLYSIIGGINPLKTLPIVLDVGTDNQQLLNDPMYIGWRHPRITGPQYDEFIEKFVHSVKQKFPNLLLQWEDFSRDNAAVILKRYRNQICSFNDDIQGTAVVTLAALQAAIKVAKQSLAEQRIVMLGAGSATTGIADLMVQAMEAEGVSPEEARKKFWIIKSSGLITENSPGITPNQRPYLRQKSDFTHWQVNDPNQISLLETVTNVKPTVLIGCSTVGGAFTETIVREMSSHVEHPIIFPLSNPTSKSEAIPSDLIAWTRGKALIATGSPFEPVCYQGKTINIAQCNNALVFPGIGLGILAVKGRRVTDQMLQVASQTLFEQSPALKDPSQPLLPSVSEAPLVDRKIGYAVAKQAYFEGLTDLEDDRNIISLVDKYHWQPAYWKCRHIVTKETV